jgi:hypothetical protein
MPSIKGTKIKNKTEKVKKEDVEESLEEGPELIPKKIKSHDISDIEPVAIIEEKIVDEPIIATEDEDDLASEEAGLDNDELNPFGDRWEE